METEYRLGWNPILQSMQRKDAFRCPRHDKRAPYGSPDAVKGLPSKG